MRQLILLMCVVILVTGCRGWRSEKAPVHMNPNMDFQASIRSQEMPMDSPENIIPWGDEASFSSGDRADYVKSKSRYYYGKNPDGSWTDRIPVKVNYALMERGRDRFAIYCTPCHGLDGSGNGAVVQDRWIKPVPYWHQRVLVFSDGQLFDIISNGIRTMPSYKQQIKEVDRWAIVAYIRALQRSNTATVSDVPLKMRSKLR